MTTGHEHDVLVAGAGAAGLMAAIWAGRSAPPGTRVAALDGAQKLGAKILVAGGGRCNVTHDVVTPRDYAGDSPNRINKVLKAFTVQHTTDFFRDLGVRLKREETGKLFPVTDTAQTVLDALLDAARQANASLHTETRITAVTRNPDDTFTLETSRGTHHTNRLILATGGKALPRSGSDGTGYAFAQHLGHTVTTTSPALVPLILADNHWLTELSGLAVDAEVRVTRSTGKIVHREQGPLLLTHFGISGPVPMNLSRHLIALRREDPDATLTANFLEGATFDETDRELLDAAAAEPALTAVGFTRRLLPERLARELVRHETGIPHGTELRQLARPQRHALARALTQLNLPVTSDRGYKFAEVTAGGVPLEEINLKTMASRRCTSLSLCGEILDVDGRIGGYNFQWAWASGKLAGTHAVT
ncbi:BaiN/RdsA family NAD(P)/FAD-dependent oxidoreductase [Mucisphaera calidilacus]|uniref:Ferredoxin--NADP reductase n=1 Tax=Mucisphaera calidilacus TaxID=2527982 RepID=A0A518BYQ0_9BACT|nr:aminoacetone oxidase family FAD-binding enzyme [Mucisphaera calidilacus]QDU72096.1 Ferredoxin--NADP reductase [Mucisphaera calidilacus]